MASKKGIIITVVILAIIGGASFVVWLLPQNHGQSIAITDYKNEIDGIKERKAVIASVTESNLNSLIYKSMTPDEFVNQTQISSTQITSLIGEMVEANPPAEWKPSYGAYYESLKKYNDYLTESITLASKIKANSDISDETTKLDSIKKESDTLASKSDQNRP